MMLADCGQDFVTDPNLLALACEDAEVFGDWVMPDYRRIAAELGRGYMTKCVFYSGVSR